MVVYVVNGCSLRIQVLVVWLHFRRLYVVIWTLLGCLSGCLWAGWRLSVCILVLPRSDYGTTTPDLVCLWLSRWYRALRLFKRRAVSPVFQSGLLPTYSTVQYLSSSYLRLFKCLCGYLRWYWFHYNTLSGCSSCCLTTSLVLVSGQSLVTDVVNELEELVVVGDVSASLSSCVSAEPRAPVFATSWLFNHFLRACLWLFECFYHVSAFLIVILPILAN